MATDALTAALMAADKALEAVAEFKAHVKAQIDLDIQHAAQAHDEVAPPPDPPAALPQKGT